VKGDFTFTGKGFSVKMFLSVNDPRKARSCPDARVPGPEDPRPSVALRGDTLLVLTQDIDGTNITNRIRRYRVRTANCKWVPAAAGTGSNE
jgi:hypothetical protein